MPSARMPQTVIKRNGENDIILTHMSKGFMVEARQLGVLAMTESWAGLGGCSKPKSGTGGEPGSVVCPASVSPSVPKGPHRVLAGSGKGALPSPWVFQHSRALL